MESTEKIKLEIESLANNGLGVSHLKQKSSGKKLVIFVANALPGEKVTAIVTHKRVNFWQAEATEIENPSPYRVTPRCPNFPKDGDCILQHLAYPEQLHFKEIWLKEALIHTGHIPEPKIEKIIPAPSIWRYRRKLEFSFFEESGQAVLGFNQRGSFSKFLKVDDVAIGPEITSQIINTFNEYFTKIQKLPAFDPVKKTGFLKNLVIQHSKFGTILVLVTTDNEEGKKQLDFKKLKKFLLEKLKINPEKDGFFWMTQKNNLSVVKPEKIVVSFGQKFFREKINETIFTIPPLGFFQNHPEAFEKLVDCLENYLKKEKNCSGLIELYAGAGVIGILIHKYFKKIVAVDFENNLIELAKENALNAGAKNINFFAEPVEKFIKRIDFEKIPETFNYVLLDPPRAGLSPKIIKWLLKNLPEKIIYFSCDPQTLARDLGFLKENYLFCLIQPADLFPQLPHLETLVILEVNR